MSAPDLNAAASAVDLARDVVQQGLAHLAATGSVEADQVTEAASFALPTTARTPAQRTSYAQASGSGGSLADAVATSNGIATGMGTASYGAQIVVDSGIRPVRVSRKWPGVFIRRGALAESPNCQIEAAAAVVASRNGKSMTIPFFSASRAK